MVGGGSILIDQSLPFQGVSKLIIPDHSEVKKTVLFLKFLIIFLDKLFILAALYSPFEGKIPLTVSFGKKSMKFMKERLFGPD